MFLIREAEVRDLEDLFNLASEANFINLPADKNALLKKINKSVASFRPKSEQRFNPREAEYIFVLEDREQGRVVGTSMIIAQHGTPDEPHTFFSVVPKKKISKSIHMGFLHQVLRLGFDFDGPTEIGGLVLRSDYRRHKQKLGLSLSFARFMFMAARRQLFRDEVLSELMPPFNERGDSPIWEEIGRKFTNLRYDEADRLSRRNKEFITSLFPEGDIYTCMMTSESREAIGQVGPDTAPVKKMLESIGFTYRNMIDPFDGGPHFWAKTSQIDPVKRTKRFKKASKPFDPVKDEKLKAVQGIALVISKKGIRASLAEARFRGTEILLFPAEIEEMLGMDDASENYFLEFKS